LSRAILLLWAVLLCSPPALSQPPPSLQLAEAPIPAGLQTVEFFSPAVARTMKFDIVLPASYDESEQRYPVVYLLHGYMQNYTVWGRNLNGAYYARALDDLILVMPDGGNTWFVNHAGQDGAPADNWEDHLIEDVIGYVDGHYRTEARREGRAIAGLSMGGFAAVSLGLRHPHMFVSVGSTSGALSYARGEAERIRQGIPFQPRQRPADMQAQIAAADAQISRIIDIPGFSTQEERTPSRAAFNTVVEAEAYDPFTIIYTVPKSQLPHFYLDAGTEDGLMAEARELLGILLLNNVAVDFMQAHGAHNSEYWRRSIGHMLTIQNEVMQRALGHRP
jgi:enterochelin esterase-like enzyme